MANPYAFGQKTYTDLDRRRQLIDQALSSTFETTNKIAQMQKQKEQENRIKAIASKYQTAMQNPDLTPMQSAGLLAQQQMEYTGIGATEPAKGSADLAGTYASIKTPEPAKPIPEYLGVENLPGGGRVLAMGYRGDKTKGTKNFITDVKQVTDRDLTGVGGGAKSQADKDKLRNELERKKEVAITGVFNKYRDTKRKVGVDAKGNDIVEGGIDLTGIIQGKKPIPMVNLNKPLYDRNEGKWIRAGTLVPDPDVINALKAIKDVETEFKNQGIEFEPAGLQQKESHTTPADVKAMQDKFTIGKKYTSNGITKTYLGNGKWK